MLIEHLPNNADNPTQKQGATRVERDVPTP